ncbi:MAG: carboxylating nicotinate-nucleotide diphosphorylase [Chloroflexi bacterium]|nr:carboxylating nicotinate-nucleotide diphosphorylase [Chloroflexota bacterium]
MEHYDIQTQKIIERAIEEDLGWGDVTTDALIPDEVQAEANIFSRCDGIVAGTRVADRVFHTVDHYLEIKIVLADGQPMHPGDVLVEMNGSAASILKAERTALNFLQRMSGIATQTRRYVDAVRGLPVHIADTRKTAPGLRVLDKYAVSAGGGMNHRMHLEDGVLIKDNHLQMLHARGVKLKDVISRIRQRSPRMLNIEIEATSVEEAQAAVDAGADIILLDNMDLETTARAVKAVKGRALIEASGGMTLERVRQVAEAGVDFISVGALTHSVSAVDLSLDIKPLKVVPGR